MNVTAKLGLYALGLVAVFAAAFGVGGLVGPVLPQEPPGHAESVENTSEDERDHGEDGARENTERDDTEQGDAAQGDAERDDTEHEERQESREGL